MWGRSGWWIMLGMLAETWRKVVRAAPHSRGRERVGCGREQGAMLPVPNAAAGAVQAKQKQSKGAQPTGETAEVQLRLSRDKITTSHTHTLSLFCRPLSVRRCNTMRSLSYSTGPFFPPMAKCTPSQHHCESPKSVRCRKPRNEINEYIRHPKTSLMPMHVVGDDLPHGFFL